MEQKALAKDKFSFIVYEGENTPRYFEIKKAAIRFLFFGLPFITVASLIVTLAMVIYFKELRNSALRKEPGVIKELKERNLELEQKLEQVALLNKEFESKLTSSTSASTGAGLSKLSLFRTTLGQLDKTNPPQFSIDDAEILSDKTNIVFKFNLRNVTENGGRVSGYLHVLAKVNGAYHRYPPLETTTDDFAIDFNSGESFATSRFRPVEATFTNLGARGKVVFQVLIFSRTGDLLHRQTISKEI